MNQWRKTLTPIWAAVLWSRSQSCSGGFDLRKYTAPNGNTGFGKGFSCASTLSVSAKAADNMPAQANCIRFMTAGNPPNPVAKNCTSGRAGNRNMIEPSLMVPRSASRSVLLIPFFTRGPGEREDPVGNRCRYQVLTPIPQNGTAKPMPGASGNWEQAS